MNNEEANDPIQKSALRKNPTQPRAHNAHILVTLRRLGLRTSLDRVGACGFGIPVSIFYGYNIEIEIG